ncbi:short-chain dehydrogenase [Mycena pura]|uniref:Short-chain dehydrogenase n=1 Tax=Mycena pura TaxID=153505 RepID=A0AAD6VD60_9AGAR|nr:short-chain dehydrogenase [Mycena pura]
MNARIQILKQVATRKWLSDQYTTLPLFSDDLRGKTVVITGANRGCGLEAAKHFAEMNVARLILACRNVDAGNLAVKEIVETTGGSGIVTCWPLDLASFDSVREFARRVDDEKLRIDIFVGNAAIQSSKWATTEDGWETVLQIDYLSHVLLTVLLLPNMNTPASADEVSKPRIVLLSSEAHYFIPRLQEADSPNILSQLNDSEYCSKQSVMDQRYFVAKLLALFFCRELARRVDKDTGPIVVAVSPGLCATDLDHESSTNMFMAPIKRLLMPLIARTAEMGSRTIIHAAVGKNEDVQHGKYLANCRVEEESAYSLSAEGLSVQVRLWDETMQILRNVDPRVGVILQGL